MKSCAVINKIVYSAFEASYRSKYTRHIIMCFYRILFFREYPAISKFIKKKKERILIAINAFEIYQFNHIKPLYAALNRNPLYIVILVGSNPQKIQLPEYQEFMNENLFILNENLFSYIWLPVLKPHIFIETAISPYHQLCYSKTTKVLLAHSLASLGFSKNHAHIKDTVTYDYILSTGPYQEKALKLAANQYKVKLPEIIRSGFIRGDILSENANNFNRHSFKIKCGLADKKTVFFAPTWGEFSATAEWIDPITDLSIELDFNLLIKLHPLMLKGKTKWETAGIDWHVKLDQLNTNPNLHTCNLYDLEDYMLASDIMITDVSSVGIEYMFLRKPVIFLPAPQFFHHFGKDKPIFWIRNGLEVQNIAELKKKLKTILSDSELTPYYDISKFSFNPGNAIESISTWISDICQQNSKDYADNEWSPKG